MFVSTSNRLQYRLFNVDEHSSESQTDIEEIFAIDQDPMVMKYLTNGKTTTRDTLDNIFIPRIHSYTNREKGYGMWRVSLKENDACIGELIVRPMHFYSDSPHFHDIELGWRFIRKSWGHGYATEAALHMMRYLQANKTITSFSAIADTNNRASISVMKKLGMQFIKNYLHSDPLGDSQVDLYRIDV
jgi:RimJ/RimL family protein N-acetyltransferase